MAGKKWTEERALKVATNAGCRIGGKVIQRPAEGVGIKTWGALDYLQGQHGYSIVKAS